MSAGPKLELRHSQSLVMTAQLQQSIRLLQMSALELQACVDQELEQNPFLTQEEPAAESPPEDNGAAESSASDDDDTWQAEEMERAPADPGDAAEESDYANVEPRFSGTHDGDEERSLLERTPDHAPTLREHLLSQWHLEAEEPVIRAIGAALIDLMDDAGYIKADLVQVAQNLNTSVERVEEALAALQCLDPAGVGARSLPECLALQLREKDRLDPCMQALLEHLDLLAAGNIEALRKRCGVDAEDMRQMIAELRALNPKPGSLFSEEMTQPVEPDVLLRRMGDGRWQVELNARQLPRVLVNRTYYAQLHVRARGPAEKKYLTDQLAHANWLVKALDQRANTLLKVATEIVAQQDAFFHLGIQHLKPLTLREVAQTTGFHESTVSRVTTSKYMATPRGFYELKFFFTSALHNASGGEDFSSESVKFLIREMVEKESTGGVLSDDEIALRLRARNITVARRTVAKYREAMHIPPSSMRKRLKSFG